MGACQWLIIGICAFLNALDGYDVLAMAFTATPVTEEFGLSGSELGFLLSAGLLGMAVGSLTVVALILVVALMPESAAYLYNRRNRNITILVWVAFFAVMFGFYFVNSWTPRLLNESGLTQNQGVIAGIMLTIGGTIGSLLFGVLTARWSTRATLFWFTIGSAAAIVLFISSASIVWAVFALGVVVGMLINGCIAGLYVLTPQSYSASVRSTGARWAIYIGVAGVVLIATVALGFLRSADIEANRAPRRSA